MAICGWKVRYSQKLQMTSGAFIPCDVAIFYSIRGTRASWSARQRYFAVMNSFCSTTTCFAFASKSSLILNTSLRHLEPSSSKMNWKSESRERPTYLPCTTKTCARCLSRCPRSPLQQTFATRTQAIESFKATHRAALAQLDALFASLQQRAFAGECRVATKIGAIGALSTRAIG